MNKWDRPDNYVELLVETVASARNSRFWRKKLGDQPVRSIADFEGLPFTSVEEYRAQTFDSIVANKGGIEWIPGPWLGQSPSHAPMAEGPTEAKVRVDLMADALKLAFSDQTGGSSALVVVERERRHFGAEICAVFVRMGVRAHLITANATNRLGELVRAFSPDVLVAMSSTLDLHTLPGSVTGVVTVGHHAMLEDKRHVDLCVQNELGVLGSRFGTKRYELNHHEFHIEQTPEGTLTVTPYFSRVQPVIRLDTRIPVSVLNLSHGPP